MDKNDILEFGISTQDNEAPFLKKSSGLGIDQDDNGNYIITVSAAEMSRQRFPRNKYRYAVRITEGDTGERYPIVKGDLYLNDLPV